MAASLSFGTEEFVFDVHVFAQMYMAAFALVVVGWPAMATLALAHNFALGHRSITSQYTQGKRGERICNVAAITLAISMGKLPWPCWPSLGHWSLLPPTLLSCIIR